MGEREKGRQGERPRETIRRAGHEPRAPLRVSPLALSHSPHHPHGQVRAIPGPRNQTPIVVRTASTTKKRMNSAWTTSDFEAPKRFAEEKPEPRHGGPQNQQRNHAPPYQRRQTRTGLQQELVDDDQERGDNQCDKQRPTGRCGGRWRTETTGPSTAWDIAGRGWRAGRGRPGAESPPPRPAGGSGAAAPESRRSTTGTWPGWCSFRGWPAPPSGASNNTASTKTNGHQGEGRRKLAHQQIGQGRHPLRSLLGDLVRRPWIDHPAGLADPPEVKRHQEKQRHRQQGGVEGVVEDQGRGAELGAAARRPPAASRRSTARS